MVSVSKNLQYFVSSFAIYLHFNFARQVERVVKETQVRIIISSAAKSLECFAKSRLFRDSQTMTRCGFQILAGTRH